MNNKLLFEEWLTSFKRNINGKKFTAVKSYLKYMGAIEKHMDMSKDSIYQLNEAKELKRLETKLRRQDSFDTLSEHYKHSLLSALHVYQNLMEILSKGKTKNMSNGQPKSK